MLSTSVHVNELPSSVCVKGYIYIATIMYIAILLYPPHIHCIYHP